MADSPSAAHPVNSEIVLVAIMGRNRVIGDGHDQPWHFKCDLRRFKEMTRGHPLILGRKTFAAIGSRPLPERTHIVMTRDPEFSTPAEPSAMSGVYPAATLEQALELAAAAPGGETIFVIGGGTIYEQFLSLAQRIELTVVDDAPQGGVLFPAIDSKWQEESRDSAEEDGYQLTFLSLRRHAP
ncbi:dihydrofolate reductase [Halorhodospira halochloris]|uniref:dihydrofolate reductase n=1 Tax=Halorhodospira halochloris TaxID=1052 RepID=UPI001EE947C8|nr:dihydrofolate reductase [Halorhodospira halochloris]MCG5548192.1 dihydrofolate reductase [Halorhodospira halochloris]